MQNFLFANLPFERGKILFSKGFFDFANTRDMQVEHHNLYPLRYLSHLQW